MCLAPEFYSFRSVSRFKQSFFAKWAAALGNFFGTALDFGSADLSYYVNLIAELGCGIHINQVFA